MGKLENIALKNLPKSIQKDIRKDFSKFKLTLTDKETSVYVTYKENKQNILINCGRIVDFKYPKKSKSQRIVNSLAPADEGRITIEFSYNKNNIQFLEKFNSTKTLITNSQLLHLTKSFLLSTIYQSERGTSEHLFFLRAGGRENFQNKNVWKIKRQVKILDKKPN